MTRRQQVQSSYCIIRRLSFKAQTITRKEYFPISTSTANVPMATASAADVWTEVLSEGCKALKYYLGKAESLANTIKQMNAADDTAQKLAETQEIIKSTNWKPATHADRLALRSTIQSTVTKLKVCIQNFEAAIAIGKKDIPELGNKKPTSPSIKAMDLLENIRHLKLHLEKPLGRKLFNSHVAEFADKWVKERRNGRHHMRGGSTDELLHILHDLEITINKSQLNDWIRGRRKFTKNVNFFYTEENLAAIHNLRTVQNMEWPEITKAYNKMFPGQARNQKALRTAYDRKCDRQTNATTGPWSEDEVAELLEQYTEHGTAWSKYTIGRPAALISQKFNQWMQRMITANHKQSFESILLSAFDVALQENGTVSAQDWKEAIKTVLTNSTPSDAEFIFKRVSRQLIWKRQIIEIGHDIFEKSDKVPRPHLKNLPRKTPLRPKLLPHQVEHIKDLIRQCETKMSTDNPNLKWFGSEKFKSIATTTTYPQPRKLHFEPIEDCFEDDFARRNWKQLFEEDNADSDFYDNDSDDEYEADNRNIILAEELVNSKEAKTLRGMHVLGVLNTKSAIDSKKHIFFLTAEENVLVHIRRQLKAIGSRTSCPSWMEAFVTTKSEIDWNNIHLFAVATEYTAALRLKLCTANFTGTSCFNVRKSIFPPIASGLVEYLASLQAADVEVDPLEIQRMQNRMLAELLPDEDQESQKILSAARQQQAEFNIEDDFGPPLVKKATNPFGPRRKLNKLDSDNSDSDSEEEQPDVDEQDFFDDIKLTEEDARALEMFQNKDGPRTRKLADVIMEKISEKQTEIHTQLSDVGSLKIEELDPRAKEMYEGVRDVMKKYRSGKVPEAFKIIPTLRNWEQILFITEPHNWSAAAMYQGARIFSSILAQHMAQRFYNLVLLPRIRDDLSEYRKLNDHLYNAMRKALFKPAAFMKGIILPLLESGDCTSREAIFFGSVIARNQIPVLHSSACLLKICEMEYNGANSIFIRIFLDKRYALPYRVVDATVSHFIRFENDKREMPVLWHQSLLTFVQRYKNDISSEQKEALFALLRKQQHPKLTPEICRELQAAKCRDVEMMEPSHNLGPMPMEDDTLTDFGIGEEDVNMQA